MLGWDVVRGLYAIGRDSGEELVRVLAERQAATIGPVEALLLAQQLGEDGLLLYSNAHRFWNDLSLPKTRSTTKSGQFTGASTSQGSC